MLKNLFRPKWQHENPEIRKAAIDNLKNHESGTLDQIALNDADQSVRLHAISKMDNLAQLEQAMEKLQNKSEQEFALKCWVSVLTNSGKLNALAVEEFIIECQKEKLLSGIIAYADKNSLRELAMSGIKNENQLISLMQNSKNGKLWQSIIEKLESEESLKQALAIVNGRDKKSQQTLNKKLDSIKNSRLENQRISEQANQLIKKLSHLADTEFNPLFEGLLLSHKQQADALTGHLPEQDREQITALVHRCNERLQEHTRQKTDLAMAEQQLAIANANHKELLQKISELRTILLENIIINEQDILKLKSDITDMLLALKKPGDEKNESLYSGKIDAINLLHEAHKIKENSFNTENNPTELFSALSLSETQQHIINLEKVTDLLLQANADKKSRYFHYINMLLEAAKNRKNELAKNVLTLRQDAKKALSETENHIEKKDLKQAQKAFSKLRKILGELPEQDSKTYHATTQRLFNAIKTLEDWKNFASDEKRNELCSAMKALIPMNDDLLGKADAIHELQQRWKNLGHCQNQEMWKTFKTYADEAYLPCQAYFEEQRKIRQFNAQQRNTICEQLELLIQQTDWSNTNWKALDRLLKTIHDEWEKFLLVDKEHGKKLNDRFFSSIKFLKAKLNDERKNNTERLSALVAQAIKLSETENIQEAIESYIELQQLWKTIGITYHKKQHELWQEFKGAGDVLYKKRQNIRTEMDSERQNNLKKAYDICQQIIELSKLDEAESGNSKAVFDSLVSRYKELGALPKEKFNSCQQAFEDACHTYNKQILANGLREWQKQLAGLTQLSDEWLAIEERHEKPVITDYQSKIPEKWLKRVYSRFDNTPPPKPSEYARILCIEMEVFANINIPEEDSALKMQWQMANLAKNFGLKQENSEMEKMEDLYLRWYSQKCWNRDEYKKLESRFLNAANKKFAA